MSFFRSRSALVVLVGAITMFVLAIGSTGVAQANDTFDVTTTTDTSSGDDNCQPGDCSLRQAVEAANNSDSGDDDTVNVPAGTYKLDDGELEPYRCKGGSLTITGAGARDTIVDGQSLDRVFYIECGPITITDLTIQHGLRDEGGGVYNDGDATTLRNVAVIDNVAQDCGIDKSSTNGDICYSGDGGGIYNDDTLTIEQSLIAGNTAKPGDREAGHGGGIFNSWEMHLTNVTLNNNAAENGIDLGPPSVGTNGPVAVIPGVGGGIFEGPSYFGAPSGNEEIELPLSSGLNLTIAGNTAGLGGGVGIGKFRNSADQNVDPVFPTLIDFKNTIVANNTADYEFPETPPTNATSDTDNCLTFEGPIKSSGHNLESDTSCGFQSAGDQQNTEPNLGGLANNGGPTNTMALPDGSPALDTADNDGCPGTDQRYVTRPQNVTCDIGAYEKEVSPPPAAAVAPAVAQAKPVAKSSISGPRSCTRGSATVRVSGQNISTVTYSLDGKKIKKAKGNKTSVRVNLKNKKSGVHRVTAKVSYTAATAAASQTKRFTVSRCARAAAKPKFTG